jgi:hypothetical protein
LESFESLAVGGGCVWMVVRLERIGYRVLVGIGKGEEEGENGKKCR